MVQAQTSLARTELPSGNDAHASTAMEVEISRIQTYDRNPRHGRNPEYDRIKASIRDTGLDQPLTITQRPGSADYIVHSGGNTRLHILKALLAESGDAQFAHIHCLFKPWQQESDLLLAHLRENDLRGGLVFIDKARAVFDFKQLQEDERCTRDISQRHLQGMLQEGGYSLSQGLISQMGYAVQTLLPLIPEALQSGMGRPQVERIRQLEKAVRHLWLSQAIDDVDFDETFRALCQRYDGEAWDIESLRRALETEVAEAADASIHSIRLALDALLAGREVTIPQRQEIQDSAESLKETMPVTDPASTTNGTDRAPTATSAVTTEGTTPAPENHAQEKNIPLPSPDPHEALSATLNPPVTQYASTEKSSPDDLKSLRARAWTLAARLAQRHGIGDLVIPLSGQGLGFVLQDVPDSALADQLDDDTLSEVSMLWWSLAACAEMTTAPVESIVRALPRDSVLRRALETQDSGLLFKSVWTLDPGHAGFRLWRQLSDVDWDDLLNLMTTYRQISRLAADHNIRIWG